MFIIIKLFHGIVFLTAISSYVFAQPEIEPYSSGVDGSAVTPIDTLLSAQSRYVLTRKMIDQSGTTTVAEALRLVPGLLVVEQRNGYFSVSIRGSDAVPNRMFGSQSVSKRLLLERARNNFNILILLGISYS